MIARTTLRSVNIDLKPELAFKDIVSQALKSSCGLQVNELIVQIAFSDRALKTKAEAILNIALKRQELPHVIVRCFTELEVLGQSWVRMLIDDVIAKPEDPDMDQVRGRALASLVKIEDLSLGDVSLLANNIHHRFTNISSQIARAITHLGPKQLTYLHAQASLLDPKLVPNVVILIKQLKDAKTRAVDISEETEDSAPLPRTKKTIPKLPRGQFLKQPIKPAIISAQPKINRAKQADSGRACILPLIEKAVEIKSSQVLKLPPISTEPEMHGTPFQQVNSESSVSATIEPAPSALRQLTNNLRLLEDLRDPSLSKKNLSELLWIKSETKDPIAICRCIAEITTRFGEDAGRDNGSDQLVWIISDPDETPAKEMARVLTHALFSERLYAPR